MRFVLFSIFVVLGITEMDAGAPPPHGPDDRDNDQDRTGADMHDKYHGDNHEGMQAAIESMDDWKVMVIQAQDPANMNKVHNIITSRLLQNLDLPLTKDNTEKLLKEALIVPVPKKIFEEQWKGVTAVTDGERKETLGKADVPEFVARILHEVKTHADIIYHDDHHEDIQTAINGMEPWMVKTMKDERFKKDIRNLLISALKAHLPLTKEKAKKLLKEGILLPVGFFENLIIKVPLPEYLFEQQWKIVTNGGKKTKLVTDEELGYLVDLTLYEFYKHVDKKNY